MSRKQNYLIQRKQNKKKSAQKGQKRFCSFLGQLIIRQSNFLEVFTRNLGGKKKTNESLSPLKFDPLNEPLIQIAKDFGYSFYYLRGNIVFIVIQCTKDVVSYALICIVVKSNKNMLKKGVKKNHFKCYLSPNTSFFQKKTVADLK